MAIDNKYLWYHFFNVVNNSNLYTCSKTIDKQDTKSITDTFFTLKNYSFIKSKEEKMYFY